jgi:hypothetical protein
VDAGQLNREGNFAQRQFFTVAPRFHRLRPQPQVGRVMDSKLIVAFILCGLSGALGGFLGRAIPNGVKKEVVTNAPAEAGIVVAMLAGAGAAISVLLAAENISVVPILSADLGDFKLPTGVAPFVLTWGHLAASFATGLAGTGWLIAHQNTKTLTAALAESAALPPSGDVAVAAGASPREALRAVRALASSNPGQAIHTTGQEVEE